MNGKNGNEGGDDEILAKLEVIGSGGWFLWKVFLLCAIPCIVNGLHVSSYVYLAEVPVHWCHVPELSNIGWTNEQIRTISSPGESNKSSCEYYDWNYEIISKMNFSDAIEYIKNQELPQLVPCSSYDFAEGTSSMVINYDLVCERTALKSMIQVSLSLGKLVGAFAFGVVSDKFGRKMSFLIGCILYVISGPVVAFASDYLMVVAGRLGLGAAGSAIYHSAFVMLSEIASKKRRAVFGILYNMGYPLGQMIVPLIAYLVQDWRTLQFIISLPSFFILGFYWILPESPRWLLLKNRKKEAAQIIDGVYAKINKGNKIEATTELTARSSNEDVRVESSSSSENNETLDKSNENADSGGVQMKQKLWEKIKATVNQMFELLRYSELRNRILINLVLWCTCSLSYYALALNVDNFHTDRYIYGFLTGLVEVPSYILSLPLLKYFGRRHTSIALFYIGGLALLSILAVPENDSLLVAVASIGRLCASAVFAVVILHTSELFPTLLRNTAIGCCSTAAHVGSMSAPFVVDLLGAYAWFIPSTVCGVVTLLSGTLVFLLPETKNKPLMNSLDEVLNAPKIDLTGFHQICSKE